MRKLLTLSSGRVVEVSPLTYGEWMALDLWSGASDMEFEAWLRANKLDDPNDFVEEMFDEGASFALAFEEREPLYFRLEPGGEWLPYSLARAHSKRKSRPQELKEDYVEPILRGR